MLAAFSSCMQKEYMVLENEPVENKSSDSLVCIAGTNLKTALNSDLNVVWKSGDAVKVYSATGSSSIY